MKWLVCVVVDGGRVFSVEIDEAATIGELKNVVKEKNPSTTTCAAEGLTLYVAKEDDKKWQKLKEFDLEQLKRGEVPEGVQDVLKEKEMDPDSIVGSIKFGFPDANEAEDGDFHIVVNSRKAKPAVPKDEATTQLTTANAGDVLGSKRKRCAHSEMSKEMANRLLQDLHIEMELSPIVASSAEPHTHVEEFKWECDSEGSDQTTIVKQQRERYHAYLEKNIGDVLEQTNLCVFGVEEEDVLNVGLPGYNMNLVGRTDVLILNSILQDQPSSLYLLRDVRMLVEVNRAVEENSVFQAMSKLIALDLLSNDPVMALLTNLTNVWHFFWVSERSDDNQVIIEHAMVTKPDTAFKIIKSLLLQSSATKDAEIRLPCIQTPVKRRKLDRMLPSIRGNTGAIIHGYYDATSGSGPNVELARATVRSSATFMPSVSMRDETSTRELRMVTCMYELADE